MVDTRPARTHTAFTLQWIGKKFGRWLEIGSGSIEGDCIHVFLDRLPVGGFTGYVRLLPQGAAPPAAPEASPQRPGAADGTGEELED
ncbi:MAG TPA: hypothetical protein VNE82_04845 [Candidatus Binataceae bacterium]|nr:hypothetical protein [Candidatus Binataceae bacterium]